MRGCRPLSETEVNTVKKSLEANKYGLRDKALFTLGTKSGFRISELLSLKVKDVWQNGSLVERVTVAKKAMKGQKASRTVIMNQEAKTALWAYLAPSMPESDNYLFKSQKDFNRPLSRVQAYRILKAAYNESRLTGKVATHSMRKTFANNVHEKLGHDIFKTQKALGHSNIKNTVFYLSFKEEEIERAILAL